MSQELLDRRDVVASSLVELPVSPEAILGVRYFMAIPVLNPLPEQLQSVRVQFHPEVVQLGKIFKITLCPPFEARTERIYEIMGEMRAVAGRFESFNLTFSRLITFPEFGVLAVRPDDDSAAMALHSSILAVVDHYQERRIIKAEALSFEGERWLPHLTVAKGEHLRGNLLQKAYQAAEGFVPFSAAVTQIAWVAEQSDNGDHYFYLPLAAQLPQEQAIRVAT